MPLLRLTQTAQGNDAYRVEIALEGERLARQTATSHFSFALTPQDQADLRWYLEDYLQWPQDPAPQIAARVEERMVELGTDLFKSIFQANDDARELWSAARHDLASTRVEIVTEIDAATALPWELLREPRTATHLALHACSFVRAQPTAARRPRILTNESGPVRILLVICRPAGSTDVPFRSVAARIVKSLNDTAREAFDLDVLRPPTFEQLARELRRAKSEGRPYHVVHFDGHGDFVEVEGSDALRRLRNGLSPLLLSGRRAGKHGYLLFENPQRDENVQLVDGPALGNLLAECEVPVLVLNACRSAYAEPQTAPDTAREDDPHDQVRAFGSLAQEAMDAGVTGVVAMRHNVYVVTAAQFVAELYASLAAGRSLGEAATQGRKNLADAPLRDVAFEAVPLQDWTVPIVYEAAPIALFPEKKDDEGFEIHVEDARIVSAAGLDSALPPTPDAGFFGRDETLLALDRAFDSQKIVLLHAYAGSGKTATVAEFARWYKLTGGVDGPVLFTSFEHYTPLARVLDRVGEVFGPSLEKSGVHWLALDDEARRQVALKVLKQVPVLWIWDNVEPVSGFPSGTESAWSEEEQRELVHFLRAARETKARFLLTSRRDERAWLGEVPARVQVPPMPMMERLQLARALAEKRGKRTVVMKDWRPLLAFSAGNPLALTVLVGQALRDGLTGPDAVAAFVEKLRAGEAAFDDVESEGRSRSLGASLAYGFEHAFNEEERRQLALLYLFQGFVDVGVLRTMGNPETSWCLPEVHGLSHDDGIALLDRAAEVGLLTNHGAGYYRIHSALPWFLRELFERHYGESKKEAAKRAFVEAMGELGNYYHSRYQVGNRDVIAALRAEEANLLRARRLARVHGWWHRVTGAMQGLRTLYGHTGRRAEWKRLVEEISPDFVDPDTGGPLTGREGNWELVSSYRVRLVQEERKWAEAERLQQIVVDWARQRAAPLLARAHESLDSTQHNTVRSLAVGLHQLGEIQRELGREACVAAYKGALELLELIGDQRAAACAFSLGHTYTDIPALRNLDQAEHWYRRSLKLAGERDRLGGARCLAQLGYLAWERFKDARARKATAAKVLRHLNEAAGAYHRALELLPADAINELAVVHNQLGGICVDAGDFDRALPHLREAIQYFELMGDHYNASHTRCNVALGLAKAGSVQDALAYAEAALRGFESYGDSTAEDARKTRQLIDQIRQQT